MKSLFVLLSVVALSTVRGDVVLDPTTKQVHVALVLDDGPIAGKSSYFVELFRKENVKATFSYIASTLEKNPQDGRDAVAAGFQVINHSYNHLHPEGLLDNELEHEIGDAQVVFARVLGVKPRFYWQPFAETNPAVERIALHNGLELTHLKKVAVSFDFLPETTAGQVLNNSTTDIDDGTVIAFHEWPDSTQQSMPEILQELKRRGCIFMTLSELIDYLRDKEKI